MRFPGAAAPLQATKAKNQRSRNSYAGFRPRQSPARPKPWYNFCMGSQICQLHLVTLFNLAPNCEDACNTVLRMPEEFEGPSACCSVNLPVFKNKNLRDPGPQAFGFFTSARAVSDLRSTSNHHIHHQCQPTFGAVLKPLGLPVQLFLKAKRITGSPFNILDRELT